MSTYSEVAIIGAGPYGLASAAHLRGAKRKTQVFGQPMEFWQQNMPAGMWLRSPWEASHISDPQKAFTLDAYERAHGIRLKKHVPLEDFVRYGQWFQQSVVPDLDTSRITRVEPAPDGFILMSGDRQVAHVKRVVIATGLSRFTARPRELQGLPESLVSHVSDHCDLKPFAGKQVIVVGAGQSAVETAVLLQENGATVEVIARAPQVRWLGRGRWLKKLPKPLNYIFFPPSDVGPPVLNWLVALPDLFRRLPRSWQGPIAYRSIRPAVSAWVRPRLNGLAITTSRKIVRAVPKDGRLSVDLDDGSSRMVDHVLMATGYRVDIQKLDFLSPELIRGIHRVNGYPVLYPGFESSVPGLHFVGATAAWSYGPLMRFVAGTDYAARGLARGIGRG